LSCATTKTLPCDLLTTVQLILSTDFNGATETSVKRAMSLTNLINQLRKSATTTSKRELIEFMQQLVVTEREISQYATFRERRYARNVVFQDKTFEIVMICWKSGQRSLIDDHENSFGAVKILQGVLTESVFELAPNGMIKPCSSRDFQTGDIQIENQFTIHQVSNLQPPSLTTISLHVYVPPLARMNLYRLYDPNMISGSSEHYNFGAGI